MFKTAIDYLRTYREKRDKALNNLERQSWFTADSASLASLFTDVFSSDDENSEWQALVSDKAKPADKSKVQAIRTKIALLTSYRHDLRVQFAVGRDHHVKTESDFDRHALNENNMAKFRMDILSSDLDVRSKGVTTV
jgi:hypothetical protein